MIENRSIPPKLSGIMEVAEATKTSLTVETKTISQAVSNSRALSNQAFIDAQNLRLGTTKDERPWKIDLVRFRVYLREKYSVDKAYYFLGSFDDDLSDMYEFIQTAGYILSFREHSKVLGGKKKGNVDTDIVFAVMRKLYLEEPFDKVVLVSGDGDYKRLVEFLIAENRFAKILFPNKKFASSLYKSLTAKYTAHLDTDDMRQKLGLRETA